MGLTCVRMRGVRKTCKSFISKHHLGKKSRVNTKDKHHLQVRIHICYIIPILFVYKKLILAYKIVTLWVDADRVDSNEIEGLTSPRVSIPRLSRTASTGFLPRGSLYYDRPLRNSSTILYSDANGLRKPPNIVKRLECTLEDLCFGCIKKVTIKRDVLTNDAQIIQEDEEVTITVKPGWKKGTNITFEGTGNKTSPTCTADVTFVIDEKPHPVFKRKGDDLEISIEIPLIDALTGCTVTIPFIGGQESCLSINDVITPGYTKSIEGQGMGLLKEEGKRGNLNIKFSVQFPQNLTEKQRSECFVILQDSCSD
ncbi:hypothetical protein LXL04_029937 [Taraxacum kok-saghyz]